ncbi:MAG: amidohydrolase [Gammaproteobacteria bacterium]
MSDLRLTLLQTELHWQNADANRDMFADLISEQADHSDLILLPEMFATGFTLEAAQNAEPDDGASAAWMRKQAVDCNVYLCGSAVIREEEKYYNRLFWAAPDGSLQHYDKRHLFRMAGEHKKYAAGNERLIVKLNDWRICPLVCYDLRFPVWSRSLNDYDLLLYVANWPATRRSAWRTLLPARAVENLCYCAGVNRIGKDGNNIEYAGDSLVADYLGNLKADAEEDAVALKTTLSLEKLNRYREKFPAWKDADSFEILNS